jgi:cyclic beta-1,2-glucan synthetase
LRVVLIENLRRLAERVASTKAAREMANLFCDQIDDLSIGALEEVRATLEARGLADTF